MSSVILQVALNGLFSGITYAMVTTGFFLTYRSARFFDLSYAGLLSIGAYTTYTLIHTVDAPTTIAVLTGAIAASTCGVGLELGAYRLLRSRGATGFVRLLGSLGVMIIAFNVLSILFGDAAVLAIADSPTSIPVGPARITGVRLVTLALAFGLLPLCLWLVRRSRWGLQQKAIFEDLELAKGVGVVEQTITLVGVALGAGIGALGSSLLAVEGSIKPGLGFDLILPALLATTAGGFRRLEGPILCAMAVGFSEQVFGWFVGIAWQEVLVASLLVMVLLASRRTALSTRKGRG